MTDKQKKPLQVVLHGMDERTHKSMMMYFQGPCKGAAVIVGDTDAETDIVDVDTTEGKEELEKLRAKNSLRPVIVLSRNELKLENTLYVEKPIHLSEILKAFDESKIIIQQKGLSKSAPKADVETKEGDHKRVLLDADERQKTAKHSTAMQLNENRYSSFIGVIPDINFDDKEQVLKAYYSPKNYFQGYVSSAFKVSISKGRVIQLNSNWQPLLIFPHSHEIWLDADDKQLRAFAALEMNKATGAKLTITAVNSKLTEIKEKLNRFHDMDAFIWKLAIWTSKGRYPQIVDIKKPIILKRWPNFTRTIITPHALRMTALLIDSPRTMLNVSEVLNVKPQYVFIFISGAYALGLVGQTISEPDKDSDTETETGTSPPPPAVTAKKKKAKGLLNKILGKLRTSN